MYITETIKILTLLLYWASQVVLVIKNLLANAGNMRQKRCGFDPWVRKIPYFSTPVWKNSIFYLKIPGLETFRIFTLFKYWKKQYLE